MPLIAAEIRSETQDKRNLHLIMALEHLNSSDVADVSPLGAGLAATRSHAPFRSRQLEVARLVMRAGEAMPRHSVEGDITVLCIEGHVALDCPGGERPLTAGKLLFLSGSEPHSVRAIEDSSLLLTIALRSELHDGVEASSANAAPTPR